MPDLKPGLPKQIWFVLAMLLVIGGMLLSVRMGWAPGPGEGTKVVLATQNTPTPTQDPTLETGATVMPSETLPVTPTATPEIDASPTNTPTTTATNTATDTPEPTATSSATATPLPTETPMPTATVTTLPTVAPPESHLWLERPIGPDGLNYVARFYTYASRLDGTYPIHHGVEFVNPMGTPILAVGPGRIVYAGDDLAQAYGARRDFYGLLVIEELDQTYEGRPVYILYGHLSEVSVVEGQLMAVGEPVGLVGMSGVAEGPHLHFEVRLGENSYQNTVNPEMWLRPRPGFGTLAGQLVGADGGHPAEARFVLYAAAAPDSPVRDLITYPDAEAVRDPLAVEDFCFGEIEAGQWLIKVYYHNRLYEYPVVIRDGEQTWVTMQMAS